MSDSASVRCTPNDAPATARAVLAGLNAAFDGACAALAHACAQSAPLDARRLDARQLDIQQLACHELAWARADLTAAQTLFDALEPGAPTVECQLAAVFSAEAAGASLARLESMHLDLGLDPAPLHALRASTAWAELRRAGASTAALTAAGRAVIAAGGEVAHVPHAEPHALARAAFRRFAADRVAPLAAAIHRDDLTVPEALLQPLREMGVFGLSVPEHYGGSAPGGPDDALMMVVVTEALSEASLGAAGSLITRPEILCRALLAGGTEAQRQQWLPRLAAGEPLCAIAMTEPDFGSDVASLALKATPAPGGWVLNGAKTWCTFAGKAGVLMVVARTGTDRHAGHKGLSLLLVEKPATDAHHFEHHPAGGGRLTGRAIPTIGYRGMHSFDLAFDDVFVPDSHVIGEAAGLGQGFYFTMAGMMGGRLQTAARSCGVMWAALRAALAYTAERRVFGAALNTYPLTLAKIARMAARLAACRHLTYATARGLDAGGGRVDASLVKLLACRSAEWVTREAQQLHGGLGYAEECAVSRYFVDARVLSIFEGAEETLALKVIARGLLEDALRPRAAAGEAART